MALRLVLVSAIGILAAGWPPSGQARVADAVLRLQIPASSAFKTEAAVPLTRAEVIPMAYTKGQLGGTIGAYFLLTNVASEACDLRPVPLQSDDDVAIMTAVRESYDKKKGPEDTVIHQTLIAEQPSPARYLFVLSMLARPNKLDEYIGEIPYEVKEAWHVGFGSGGSMTVFPKGVKPDGSLPQVRLATGSGDWHVFVKHASAKDQLLRPRINITSRLVFERRAEGPFLRLEHKDKSAAFSASLPVTRCPRLPDDGKPPWEFVR